MRTTGSADQEAARERDTFDRALAPHQRELLQAARREVRYRRSLGEFAPDHPIPEELLDRALQRAWRERARLSPHLGLKALALAAIFRTGEEWGAREAKRNRRTRELLPEEVEANPLYEEDEDFWQSYELERPRHAQVVSGNVDDAEDDPADDDELAGSLAPREREVLLMHEVHGVSLPHVATALGIAPKEAEHLLARARGRGRV